MSALHSEPKYCNPVYPQVHPIFLSSESTKAPKFLLLSRWQTCYRLQCTKVVFTLHTLPVRDCRLPLLMNLNSFVVRAFFTSYKMSKGIKRLGETALQPEPKKPAFGHWANGLLAAMDDPNLRVYSDERVVVIKDRYPKAKFHFLVLPKEPLSSLKVVELKHIDLLQYMHDVGQRIAKKEEHGNRTFKLGYHAEPSMNRLHLHVISDDFCSDCLKTKKHYNSFVTEHFIDSGKLIESMKTSGKIISLSSQQCKDLLNKPLVCFKCGEKMTNMPKLKDHLHGHIKEK